MVDMAHIQPSRRSASKLCRMPISSSMTHRVRNVAALFCRMMKPSVRKSIRLFSWPSGRSADARYCWKGGWFWRSSASEFRAHMEQAVANARILGETLIERGLDIVSGGTDTHLELADLRPKGLTGNICVCPKTLALPVPKRCAFRPAATDGYIGCSPWIAGNNPWIWV